MKKALKSNRCSRSGFTLVELLVVCAVIAVLASIGFPVLQRVRERSKTVTCLSNMRQIGLALNMYLNDQQEIFPAAYDYPSWRGGVGDPVGDISLVLNSYLGVTNNFTRSRVWVCPAGQRFGRRVPSGDDPYFLAFGPLTQSWGFFDMTYRWNSKPTRDKNSMNGNPGISCYPQYANRLTSRSDAAILWDMPDNLDGSMAYPGLGTPALHGKGINCLFVDGHVQLVKVAYDGGGNGLATPGTLWWFAGEWKGQGWDGAKVPGTDQP